MAYETGTCTTQQDFLNKLQTFLASEGWTVDDWDTAEKELALHKSTVYVSFRWDATATTGGISVHHALGFTGGAHPGYHLHDSGNGAKTGSPIVSQRRLSRVGNAFQNYWIFAGTTFCHVVLEYLPGLYRHLSFGILEKMGTWTGGEYAAGHVWETDVNAIDDPRDTRHTLLFDGANTNSFTEGATIHADGLPGEPSANTQFVVIWAGGSSVGNDSDGYARGYGIGGMRDGFYQNALGWIRANPNSGYVPLIPIQVWYVPDATGVADWRLLGYTPDMRLVNIGNMVAAQEFTVGADTWKVFPWTRKQYLLANAEESWNGGIAYKKVV